MTAEDTVQMDGVRFLEVPMSYTPATHGAHLIITMFALTVVLWELTAV